MFQNIPGGKSSLKAIRNIFLITLRDPAAKFNQNIAAKSQT